MLSARLGMPPAVRELFVKLTKRWDGKGAPARLKGEQVPLVPRIIHVAPVAPRRCSPDTT
jgi:response regulator RpfG family c-di-GMP phosphodiesterase